MGHWIPYRLEQTKSTMDTAHARYIGSPVDTKYTAQFYAITIYDLYYHDGQLYYTYWNDDCESYTKWGEKWVPFV